MSEKFCTSKSECTYLDCPTAFCDLSEKCEHKFAFLRQQTEEVTWHNFKKYDVYFCEKCLEYKRIEVSPGHRFGG
jgi:hypothetical protein